MVYTYFLFLQMRRMILNLWQRKAVVGRSVKENCTKWDLKTRIMNSRLLLPDQEGRYSYENVHNWSVCLAVCLLVCLFVCLSTCPSVCLSTGISVFMLLCQFHISVCFYACHNGCLFIPPPTCPPPICPQMCTGVCTVHVYRWTLG